MKIDSNVKTNLSFKLSLLVQCIHVIVYMHVRAFLIVLFRKPHCYIPTNIHSSTEALVYKQYETNVVVLNCSLCFVCFKVLRECVFYDKYQFGLSMTKLLL